MEAAAAAAAACALVRVTGRDAGGQRASAAAFHSAPERGVTALSVRWQGASKHSRCC